MEGRQVRFAGWTNWRTALRKARVGREKGECSWGGRGKRRGVKMEGCGVGRKRTGWRRKSG